MPNWKSYESSVRLLSAIVAAHPQLKLNYDAIAHYFKDGTQANNTTGTAIQHVFRPIKKEAEAMKAAIAREYGDGVTDNAAAPKTTPRKRAAVTPKSKKAAMINSGVSDDEENSFVDTPSKKAKSALNKTAGGRIQKATPVRSRVKVSYEEPEDDDEDEEDMGTMVKQEAGYGSSFASQNGNGNGYHQNNDSAYGQPAMGMGQSSWSTLDGDDAGQYFAAEEHYEEA